MGDLSGAESLVASAYERLLPKVNSFSSDDQLINEYCVLVNTLPLELKSKKRTKRATVMRAGIYGLLRERDLSLGEIGIHFGGRDHSTVLYVLRRFTHLFEGVNLSEQTSADSQNGQDNNGSLETVASAYLEGRQTSDDFLRALAMDIASRHTSKKLSLDSKVQ